MIDATGVVGELDYNAVDDAEAVGACGHVVDDHGDDELLAIRSRDVAGEGRDLI